MFDLNEKKFGGVAIFNNGDAGLVKETEISVERKKQGDPDTYPDYKLLVDDGTGAKINQGFYYPVTDPSKSAEENEKKVNWEVGRIISIAKATMGNDYTFPQVNNAKEAFDVLFKLVNDNAGAKRFNVFVTYGNINRPSKFLGLRYFDFIESGDILNSRLRSKPNDLLERVEEDAPTSSLEALGSPATKKSENWV